MKKIYTYFIAPLVLLVIFTPLLLASVSYAQCIATVDQPCSTEDPGQPTPNTNGGQPTPSSNGGGQPTPSSKGMIINPLGVSNPDISAFIKNVLDGAFTIAIPIIALAIIYCGFLFVAAQGKPEAITKAKSALLYTIIGSAILLGAWAIANLIVDTVKGLS